MSVQVSATTVVDLTLLSAVTTVAGLSRNSISNDETCFNERVNSEAERDELALDDNRMSFEVTERKEEIIDSVEVQSKKPEPLIADKHEQSAYNSEKLEIFEQHVKEWHENTGVSAVTITFYEGHIHVVAPSHLEQLKRNAEFKEFFLKALLQSSPTGSGKTKMNVVEKKSEESEEETQVSCDKCSKTFTNSRQLHNHQVLVHHPKNLPIHRCEKCGKHFQAAAFLQTHLCNRKGLQKDHECKICGTRFTSNSSMKMHLRIHSVERPYICKLCGKGFPRRSSLNYHLTKHTGEKDFQCSTCGKEFALSSNLKDHERIHSGEKPFTCQECGKSFTVSSTLRRHLLIHSGEKPFPCGICDSRFTRLIHLQAHMRMHNGEKPFGCNECNKKFTQSSHLKRHLKIHERDKNQNCAKCGQELKLKEKDKHNCTAENDICNVRQLSFPYNFVQAS